MEVKDKAWRRGRWAALLVSGLLAWGASWAQNVADGKVFHVQRGETFSSIAAQVLGSSASWQELYRPRASGLPNPNRLLAGAKLELVSDAQGRYLRLIGHDDALAAPEPAARAQAPAQPAAAKPAPPAAAAVALTPLPMAALSGEFVVGVLPNIAQATLVNQYAAFKRYLERQNPGLKVRVVIPPNFKVFFDAMMAGEYDLAVAAPHVARVVQQDRGMVPLTMYEPRTNGLFIAPIDSTVAGAKDVRERAVAFANPQSLVAMYGQQWLRQQGLEGGRDYEVKGARTDMGVGRMMLTNEAAAAVMSNVELRALPPEESARLRIVEVIARIPNFILMASPKLDRERLARLKAQMKGLLSDREDGAEFARATGFTGMVDADEALMREMEPFAPLTRKVMGVAK